MSAKRFRIAFSFAGEKRPFVKEVADLLAKLFSAEGLPHARRAVGIFTRLGSPGLAEAQATLNECEGK